MTYPVQKPPKLVFRNDAGRTTPLTSIEIDSNFVFLDDNLKNKLNSEDFNSNKIVELLLSSELSSSEQGINAGKLVGKRPSVSNTPESIVMRDSNGNFSANEITAGSFKGKSTNSSESDVAIKLKNKVKINDVDFDGSENITIKDSSKLSKTGDTTSGKITFGSSSSAPINIISNETLPNLSNGDLLIHDFSLKLRIAGVTRKIAFSDGDITGSSQNVNGIVAISNGGTGKNNAQDARIALSAAKSGINNDITELKGLSTALSAAQGGTGLKTVGENNNVLMSDGTRWKSANIIEVLAPTIETRIDSKVESTVSTYFQETPTISVKEQEGYTNILGGLILMWGNFILPVDHGGSQLVSFKKKFPNKILHMFVSVDQSSDKMIGVINKTSSSATIKKAASDFGVRTGSWFAIGY